MGKNLCRGLFFDDVAGFRRATLLKISFRYRWFFLNFVTFLRTLFLFNRTALGDCFWKLSKPGFVLRSFLYVINKIGNKNICWGNFFFTILTIMFYLIIFLLVEERTEINDQITNFLNFLNFKLTWKFSWKKNSHRFWKTSFSDVCEFARKKPLLELIFSTVVGMQLSQKGTPALIFSLNFPVDARCRFNVYKMYIRHRWRLIDVEMTSCVYWVCRDFFSALLNSERRSSHPEVFCAKAVLKNFTKFREKHLRQRLFFNKVAGAARDSGTDVFLWILRNFQ